MCDPWQTNAFIKGIFGGAARNLNIVKIEKYFYFLYFVQGIPRVLSTGCPMKHASKKPSWKSSLILEFISDIQSLTFFQMYDFLNNNHRILLILAFPNVVCLFCAGDIKNYTFSILKSRTRNILWLLSLVFYC